MKRLVFTLLPLLAIVFSCAKQQDMYSFGGAVYTISVDMTEIKDVSAANPYEAVLVVKTDAPYLLVQTPSWITPSALTFPGSVYGSVISFDIDANYYGMATTTAPRSGVIKISGGRTFVQVPVSQLGHEGRIDPGAMLGGIHNLNEFMDFVTAVNDGEDPVRWMNADGEVELLADIDLSSVEEWEPIGNVGVSGNVANATSPSGTVFHSVFNGGGHTIRGFTARTTLTAEMDTWGLFGYLDHATVKNLNLEDVNINIDAAAKADAGILAGTMRASTVENVKVTGVVESAGTTAASSRFSIGGIAGYVFSVYDESTDTCHDSVIKDCTVSLSVDMDCGANVTNGAASVMYGGIAGFCTGVKETPSRNRIQGCVNKGNMTMNLGRASGIVPTANYGTILQGCTNDASQVNSFVNGRIGQICCNLSINSCLIDCVNNGDLTTSDPQTTTAALVALMGDDSVYIEGGSRIANTGTIVGAYPKYLSLLCANNNYFDHVSGVILSGRRGKYSADGKHSMYNVTSGNIMQHIGYIRPAYADRVTGISYVDPGEVPEGPGTEGGIEELNPTDGHWNN